LLSLPSAVCSLCFLTASSRRCVQHYIHMNALTALRALAPVRVVIFSKETEIAQLGQSLGVEVVTEFDTNPYGTPLLKSMFAHVEHHSNSKFVG
jgi:hypothetical protein